MIWNNKSLPTTTALRDLEIHLNAKVSFPSILVNLLVQNGYDTIEKVQEFLRPSITQLHSPWLFKDMEKAVDRILLALRRGEKIMLFGDYDVDGTTSVALMRLFFADWGFDVEYYIPDRFTEGYGLSFQGIDHAQKLGVTLMITLDCGAKAVDKVRYATTCGMDVIVVDHHTVGVEPTPCYAMINPRQLDCVYPFKELPACALGMKLAQALAERMPGLGDKVQVPEENDVLNKYRDLATLSIASDIVPLVGENRVIAALGLKKIQENPSAGIAALMKLAGEGRKWGIEDLVFFIGPRINSAGRLYSARESVELLMGKGPEITEFAATLHSYNQERRELDTLIYNEALAKLEQDPQAKNRCSTVLWDKDWNKGVIGIVASRLIERVYRPTVLLTESNGKWVGSARSVAGFDLYAALEACNAHLVQFGGHKYAAGLTLDTESLEDFKAAFDAHVCNEINETQKTPQIDVVGELAFHQISERLIRQIQFFGPFGPENQEPVFVARRVEVKEMRILKDVHLKLQVGQGNLSFEAIGFNLAWRWAEVNATLVDIAFQPDLKSYNGKVYIQLKIKDLTASI